MAWQMCYGPHSSMDIFIRWLNLHTREIFHPDFDLAGLPAHIYLRSVHNISIERSWLRLRLDWGDNAVIAFEKGKDDGIYNPDDAQH